MEDDEVISPSADKEVLVDCIRDFQTQENALDFIKLKMSELFYEHYQDEFAFFQQKAIKEVRGLIEASLPTSYKKRDKTIVNLFQLNVLMRKYNRLTESNLPPDERDAILLARSNKDVIRFQVNK